MKITEEHFDQLKKALDSVLKQHPKIVEQYETGNFVRSELVKDLQKRFCFDVLYLAKINGFMVWELYEYLDDSHIYTALRKICPKVEKRY